MEMPRLVEASWVELSWDTLVLSTPESVFRSTQPNTFFPFSVVTKKCSFLDLGLIPRRENTAWNHLRKSRRLGKIPQVVNMESGTPQTKECLDKKVASLLFSE